MSTTPRRLRPMRRWISCVRPPIEPRAASRWLRSVPGARQHAVLGGDPAAALAAHPARHAVLDRGRADDARVADADEDRSLGELQVVGNDLHRPQLVRDAAVGRRPATRVGAAGRHEAADSTRRSPGRASPQSRARRRKAAICSRVTIRSGQYRPSPQPLAMPAAARRLMASWCVGRRRRRRSHGRRRQVQGPGQEARHLGAGHVRCAGNSAPSAHPLVTSAWRAPLMACWCCSSSSSTK